MQLLFPFLIILTIGSISFALIAICQTAFLYIYDSTSRNHVHNIITLKTVTPDLGQTIDTQRKKEIFEDSIGEQTVLINPNSAHGELKIEIQGYQQLIETAIYLYTLSGKLLQTQSSTDSTFSLDLSSCAIGTYILKIVLDDKVSDWKIVKE